MGALFPRRSSPDKAAVVENPMRDRWAKVRTKAYHETECICQKSGRVCREFEQGEISHKARYATDKEIQGARALCDRGCTKSVRVWGRGV